MRRSKNVVVLHNCIAIVLWYYISGCLVFDKTAVESIFFLGRKLPLLITPCQKDILLRGSVCHCMNLFSDLKFCKKVLLTSEEASLFPVPQLYRMSDSDLSIG